MPPDSIDVLVRARDAMSAWLADERKLALNAARGEIVTTAQPSCYLGYRISRAGILPGPKAKRRLRARLHERQALDPRRVERSLIAYRGMMLCF